MKTLFEWIPEFSVGCDTIDNQHKRLINIINRLFDAFSNAQARNIINDIIDELAQYTVYHFSTEETLMQQYNFDHDKYLQHKKEHQYFIQKVEEFKKRALEQDYQLTYDIFNFLQQWLKDHILYTDKLYSGTICVNTD